MARTSNAQKTPFAKSMELWALQKSADANNAIGKAFPASVTAINGSIVTVKFEVNATPWNLPEVTVPMVTFQYIRPPIQIGEMGAVIAFDALLGHISGLGASAPPSIQLAPSNLGGLAWVPLASLAWTAPDDPNAVCIYGPNGFRLRDTNNNCSVVSDTQNITITAATSITLKVGSKEVVLNSSGLTIDGILFDTHYHTGVTTGTGNTGGPA